MNGDASQIRGYRGDTGTLPTPSPMPRTRLTTAALNAPASPGGERVVFDTEIAGYALKVTEAGRRILIFQYRSPVEVQPGDPQGRGRRRRISIGELGTPVTLADGSSAALTAHTGRRLASALRGLVAAGRDPFLERRESQEAHAERLQVARARARGARLVRDTAEDFLADATARGRSPKTIREWKRLLEKHVVSVIGERPIAEVGRADAERVREAMPRGRRVLANRVQQVCCSLLNFAADARGAAPNPFVAGKRGANRWYREEQTRRPITREELGRLFAALDEELQLVRGDAVDAVRFLALTGWRKGEALSLRWDAIDFSSGLVVLGRTKTGRSERALSPDALALLQAIPSRGAYVFPSRDGGHRPRTEIKRTWLRVRARAGIEKPLHALRHAAATIALSEGVPLATVGALLGHRDPATTLRYARIEQETALRAAAVMGSAIRATAAPAAVTPIHGRRARRA